jgi:UDP-glucose 4-epimerase
MKIMVTGGAGFIGSHVVDALIEEGHEVSIIDNLWAPGGGRSENLNPQARFYQIDVRDNGLADAVEENKPEVIYHLAAQQSIRISTDDPSYDAAVNILGLINLLRCAVRFGTRKVIFSSSVATYGTAKTIPINENCPQNPRHPYGISKMSGEFYLRFWKEKHNLDFTILRYSNVYGPRQNPTGKAGVISIFIRAILSGNQICIEWDGKQKKDFVYVRDVARSNLLALSGGSGEAFNIASGEGTSVNAIHRILVGMIGNEVQIIKSSKRLGDSRLSYFDCNKAGKKLSWKAEMKLEDGLFHTVNYFRDYLNRQKR